MTRRLSALLTVCAVIVCAQPTLVAQSASAPIVVASKPFGESYILAEMFAQLLEAHGIAVTRRPGLGATDVAFAALRTNAIDVYPEYSGTGLQVILKDTLPAAVMANSAAVFAHVQRASVERFGVRWLPSLGFENTYAIAVLPATAARLKLQTLTDLARNPRTLSGGMTSDFIAGVDGLPALTDVYGLQLKSVRPLAPALKYQALLAGSVDVIDAYSTDGLLARYKLVVLADDRHVFPPYDASAVLSPRVTSTRPDVIAVLTLLSGRIDALTMRALNSRVEVDQTDVRVVAHDALASLGLLASSTDAVRATSVVSTGFPGYVWNRRANIASLALRHLLLVIAALFAAAIIAIPLGLLLERSRQIAEPVIRALGVLQTIPSLALLAFMIPLLGIGVVPALVAMFLYSLYPIARNTFSGVRDADPAAIEAAEALGATPMQRLLMVRLPLAAPMIMAGVRTAAVLTVGAATLAAFIGAGGLGEPIVTGLALADTRMILSGALPAAALALLVDGALALVERAVTPTYRKRRTGNASETAKRGL
jgi:osmoprotectant transport system permease protein